MPCTKVRFYPLNFVIFLSAEVNEILKATKNTVSFPALFLFFLIMIIYFRPCSRLGNLRNEDGYDYDIATKQ